MTKRREPQDTSRDERDVGEKLRNGELVEVGGRLLARCQRCGSIVRVDKPVLGGIHLCR